MKIISHRGGAKLAPENSLEAIKVSRSLGADAAEIDIRLTSDQVLVVFHDKSLNRLAGINKRLSSYSYDELSKIKLKSGVYIPSLADLIKVAGDLPLVIEGKGVGWAEHLAKQLVKYPYIKSLRVISFNKSEIAKFKKLRPDINCLIIGFFNGFKLINFAVENNLDGIDMHFLGFNGFVYRSAKKKNLRVVLYTANSVFTVKILLFLFPAVDITTDRPEKLLKLIKRIEE